MIKAAPINTSSYSLFAKSQEYHHDSVIESTGVVSFVKGMVSIIIPAFNIEDFLPMCLETVSRQTYNKLEIILVDDGSTDNTGNICDEFAAQDKRAKVFHHEANKQVWAARNTGQAAAHGEFIMFVDGDDYLHLEAIRIMYEAINSGEGYDIAIIGHKITNTDNEDIETVCTTEIVPMTQEEVIRIQSNSESNNVVWNKLYRRVVINDVRSHEYSRAQDIDFSIRSYLRIKNAVFIKQHLYYWRQREGSATHKPGSLLEGQKCVVKLLYDNVCFLPKESIKYRHYLLKRLYIRMINLIYMTWSTSEKDAIIRQCRQYEKDVHKLLMHDPSIGAIEKIAFCMNVRHPYAIRFFKRLTGAHLSWSLLDRF